MAEQGCLRDVSVNNLEVYGDQQVAGNLTARDGITTSNVIFGNKILSVGDAPQLTVNTAGNGTCTIDPINRCCRSTNFCHTVV